MNPLVNKTEENKSKAVANSLPKQQGLGKSTFQIVDNRPEANVQKKLREITHNSPKASQLKMLQDMASNSPKTKQALQLQQLMDSHATHQEQPLQKKAINPVNSEFMDMRPQTLQMRKTHSHNQDVIHENDTVTTELKFTKAPNASMENKTSSNTIQRIASVDLLYNDDTKKKIRATGKVKDFKEGSSAGKFGWLGVKSYRASYEITDGTYEDSGEVGPLQNTFTNPEAGHVLAQQNGGDGSDTWNIFAQDGGTNNGVYKSFENKMRKDLNKYKKNDDVIFTSYLAGDAIEEGGKIASAGLGNGMDISSEDSDY